MRAAVGAHEREVLTALVERMVGVDLVARPSVRYGRREATHGDPTRKPAASRFQTVRVVDLTVLLVCHADPVRRDAYVPMSWRSVRSDCGG